MKKRAFKSIIYLGLLLCSFVLIAQTAPDEDTNPDLSCPASDEFRNETRTSSDVPNPANVGTIDDRSCYADYSESNIDGTVWGVYNITNGSNHLDTNGLQPRIERTLDRSQTSGIGSYARFTGTLRILEVGSDNLFFNDGSYFMQAKGKHTGGGGSPDPAICLFLAMPIYGSGANSNVQVAFEIFREQIVNREGQREMVLLTTIPKDTPTNIELEVGFRADPNNPSKKIHYADAVIGGQIFNWNIPEPERGIQSGIRYGSYRVKGGRAQFRWANTTYEKEEVAAEPIETDDPDLTEGIYSLKNLATGQFLTDAGLPATAVTMSDLDDAPNTHWRFVRTGAFFNIDSETLGILRAPGSGGPGGPFVVVSTERPAPESTSDKIWIINYNASNNTFRFESASGRYLYQRFDGDVTHTIASETDARSIWEAIPISEALSSADVAIREAKLKIYPNPTEGGFTIALPNVSGVKNVEIYSILGKRVYQNTLSGQSLEVKHADLKTGIYLVNVNTEDNKVLRSKLIVK